MLEVQRISVNKSDLGVSIKKIRGALQSTWGEPVVRRHEEAIVTVGPLQQALVVGCDVPSVDCMDDHLYAGVASSDLPGHLSAAIRRGVVDDEHSYINALLVIQHAGDGFVKKMTVVVARDNDAA
jgi:hypothetical protein